MKKIPLWIWLAVVAGLLAEAEESSYNHSGPLVWLIGVLVMVIAYYAEKISSSDKG